MANENGEWIMNGLDWDNPYRIRTWRELINWINEIGFLPLFQNEIEGFSVEEHVSPLYWWTGETENDPYRYFLEYGKTRIGDEKNKRKNR